jgi:hypothetical protein
MRDQQRRAIPAQPCSGIPGILPGRRGREKYKLTEDLGTKQVRTHTVNSSLFPSEYFDSFGNNQNHIRFSPFLVFDQE